MAEARRMGKSGLFAHFAERSSGTQLTGREFEDHIAERLKKARLKFQRNPAIGGVQPDFLVTGPRGQRVVIEAKAWDPRGGNTARALEQVAHYQSLAGADKAFIVLPVSQKTFEAKGVVNADGLVEAVSSFLKQPTRRDKRAKRREPSRRRTIFAAMPFSRDYDDTYFVAMSYAAEQLNAACTRVDREDFAGDIVEEIRRLIKASKAVIADLSEGKPNVLYEAGFLRTHWASRPSTFVQRPCPTFLSMFGIGTLWRTTAGKRRNSGSPSRDA